MAGFVQSPLTAAGNVRSYFSGHYQRYGFNIQAATDHAVSFIFMAVAALAAVILSFVGTDRRYSHF
jgi:hypothetical protein